MLTIFKKPTISGKIVSFLKIVGEIQQLVQKRSQQINYDVILHYTSLTALILSDVSIYSEHKQIVLPRREFICMLCIKQRALHLMISLFAFSEEFNATTKCGQKRVQQDKIFHLKVATASALMSGDALATETIYNFYIRLA